MKLDLNIIRKQIDYYHLKLSEILTGFDKDLEHQKKQIPKIRVLELELLNVMERLDKIEYRLDVLNKKNDCSE
jgi:hypothetical protein